MRNPHAVALVNWFLILTAPAWVWLWLIRIFIREPGYRRDILSGERPLLG